MIPGAIIFHIREIFTDFDGWFNNYTTPRCSFFWCSNYAWGGQPKHCKDHFILLDYDFEKGEWVSKDWTGKVIE